MTYLPQPTINHHFVLYLTEIDQQRKHWQQVVDSLHGQETAVSQLSTMIEEAFYSESVQINVSEFINGQHNFTTPYKLLYFVVYDYLDFKLIAELLQEKLG